MLASFLTASLLTLLLPVALLVLVGRVVGRHRTRGATRSRPAPAAVVALIGVRRRRRDRDRRRAAQRVRRGRRGRPSRRSRRCTARRRGSAGAVPAPASRCATSTVGACARRFRGPHGRAGVHGLVVQGGVPARGPRSSPRRSGRCRAAAPAAARDRQRRPRRLAALGRERGAQVASARGLEWLLGIARASSQPSGAPTTSPSRHRRGDIVAQRRAST